MKLTNRQYNTFKYLELMNIINRYSHFYYETEYDNISRTLFWETFLDTVYSIVLFNKLDKLKGMHYIASTLEMLHDIFGLDSEASKMYLQEFYMDLYQQIAFKSFDDGFIIIKNLMSNTFNNR